MRILATLVLVASLAACGGRPDATDARQAAAAFAGNVGAVPVERLSFAVTQTTDRDVAGSPPTRVFLATGRYTHRSERTERAAGQYAGLDEVVAAAFRIGDEFSVDYEIVFERGQQGWRSTAIRILRTAYPDARPVGRPR